jgi:NADP-dependent 3-hydroxy acid dehydrogenase YdfG
VPIEIRDLRDTVVVVIGATAGIGAATTTALLEEGAKVVATGRRKERLDELAGRSDAENLLTVAGDVRDSDHVRDVVAQATRRFGRIDSIVVNAGVGLYGGITDASEDELTAMIETNVNGTVWAVRAAVDAFRTQGGGGDIVIVASVAGLRGGGNEAVYSATKFAQVGLAGSLDREVRAEGIRVSVIAPAGTHTEFAIGRGRTEGDPALEEFLRPDDVAHQIRTVLAQPRRLRTTLWTLWSMAEGS